MAFLLDHTNFVCGPLNIQPKKIGLVYKNFFINFISYLLFFEFHLKLFEHLLYYHK